MPLLNSWRCPDWKIHHHSSTLNLTVSLHNLAPLHWHRQILHQAQLKWVVQPHDGALRSAQSPAPQHQRSHQDILTAADVGSPSSRRQFQPKCRIANASCPSIAPSAHIRSTYTYIDLPTLSQLRYALETGTSCLPTPSCITTSTPRPAALSPPAPTGQLGFQRRSRSSNHAGMMLQARISSGGVSPTLLSPVFCGHVTW